MKRLKGMLFVLAGILLCCVVGTGGIRNCQASEIGDYYYFTVDDNNTIWGIAILTMAGTNPVIFASGSDQYSQGDTCSIVREEENGSFDFVCNAEYADSWDDITVWIPIDNDLKTENVFQWNGVSGGENMQVYHTYDSNDTKYDYADSSIGDVLGDVSDNIKVFSIDSGWTDVHSDILYPAFAMDAQGLFVGVVSTADHLIGVQGSEEGGSGEGNKGSDDSNGGSGDSGGSDGRSGDSGNSDDGSNITDLPDFKRYDTPDREQILLGFCAVLAVLLIVVVILFIKKGKKPDGEQNIHPYGPTEPIPPTPLPRSPYPDIDPDTPIPSPQQLSMDKYYLVCKGGYMDGRTYDIGDKLTIGRDPSSTIVYPRDYKGVSRQHIVLQMWQGKLMLTDTSSTGTYLQRLHGQIQKNMPIALSEGDVFFVGDKRNGFMVGKH